MTNGTGTRENAVCTDALTWSLGDFWTASLEGGVSLPGGTDPEDAKKDPPEPETEDDGNLLDDMLDLGKDIGDLLNTPSGKAVKELGTQLAGGASMGGAMAGMILNSEAGQAAVDAGVGTLTDRMKEYSPFDSFSDAQGTARVVDGGLAWGYALRGDLTLGQKSIFQGEAVCAYLYASVYLEASFTTAGTGVGAGPSGGVMLTSPYLEPGTALRVGVDKDLLGPDSGVTGTIGWSTSF